ncbi:ABC transporter substrate-binding protein [Maricaulis sp.]|uniref:ABC transporter substrate-binding protein n=1 Tax=Maricaulis sp. TaxID=1486257 RepID=UPI003A93E2F6
MSLAITRPAGLCISACVFAMASASCAPAQDTTPPQGGIVSASLCADAYVLALEPVAGIQALSWQVDQPISAAPDWARQLPRAWPDAERLFALDPAFVVFGAGEGGRSRVMLERSGYQSFELAWAEDFDGVRGNLLALGAMLGREIEAAAAVEALDERLAELEQRSVRRGAIPGVAYLSASGGSAGSGTYVDAAIKAAGGRNAVAGSGVTGWGRSDPELALTLEADIILTSYFTDGFAGTLSRATRHHAYRRLLDSAGRVDIASANWPCAGPHLIDAAEAIADALDEWAQRS